MTSREERIEAMPAEEVLQVIASVDEGRSRVAAVHLTWREMGAGDVLFRVVSGEFKGWELQWFNDSMDWDYLDHVWAPDGRELDFDDFVVLDFDCPLTHVLPSNPEVWETAPCLREPWRRS